jgi:hypothetical protein
MKMGLPVDVRGTTQKRNLEFFVCGDKDSSCVIIMS